MILNVTFLQKPPQPPIVSEKSIVPIVPNPVETAAPVRNNTPPAPTSQPLISVVPTASLLAVPPSTQSLIVQQPVPVLTSQPLPHNTIQSALQIHQNFPEEIKPSISQSSVTTISQAQSIISSAPEVSTLPISQPSSMSNHNIMQQNISQRSNHSLINQIPVKNEIEKNPEIPHPNQQQPYIDPIEHSLASLEQPRIDSDISAVSGMNVSSNTGQMNHNSLSDLNMNTNRHSRKVDPTHYTHSMRQNKEKETDNSMYLNGFLKPELLHEQMQMNNSMNSMNVNTANIPMAPATSIFEQIPIVPSHITPSVNQQSAAFVTMMHASNVINEEKNMIIPKLEEAIDGPNIMNNSMIERNKFELEKNIGYYRMGDQSQIDIKNMENSSHQAFKRKPEQVVKNASSWSSLASGSPQSGIITAAAQPKPKPVMDTFQVFIFFRNVYIKIFMI